MPSLAEIGALERDDSDQLAEALTLWQTVQCLLRLTIEGYFKKHREDEISEGLQLALVQATGEPDFSTLQARMKSTANAVSRIYKSILGNPA